MPLAPFLLATASQKKRITYPAGRQGLAKKPDSDAGSVEWFALSPFLYGFLRWNIPSSAGKGAYSAYEMGLPTFS